MFKLVEMVFNLPWNLPFLGAKRLASPEQTGTGKDISNPFMVLMVYQKSYSIQLTMIHVLRVELVISPPWICTLLVAKGLTTPELMANCVAEKTITSCCQVLIMLKKFPTISKDFKDEGIQRNLKFTSEDQVRGGLLGNIVNRLKSVSYNT
ncbi:hypothetical protein Tco_0508139 [Tanacetum coccineum]